MVGYYIINKGQDEISIRICYDNMTILMAFQTPEVEVIGLATIFGNVTTKDATRNALLLCEAAGYLDVPMVEGSSEPLKAVKRDSTFASKVKRIVVLGDSFFALGNVNPAAEANGENIDVVGINITTQVKLKDADLEELKQSEGKHAKFVCDMCKFYRDWHVKFSWCLCCQLYGYLQALQTSPSVVAAGLVVDYLIISPATQL
uniref:Inosine-uridine preferring nucleoside hydrolase n=1 Tax=Solanum tuberosum TaxID=4113 RepID=M1B3D8_SOLTU